MKEEVDLILEKLDNTDEIKRLKELNIKLNNNHEYISLMNEFITNKDDYITNNVYNEKLIDIRKRLFKIEELNEYLKLQNELRLLFSNINNEIISIIN